MKKNKEKILKYLSHLMKDDERILFEKELSLSSELKNEFDEINHQLDELKFKDHPQMNDLYFANLIPKINQKLEKRSKAKKYAGLYYLAPTLSVVLIIFLFLFNSKKAFEDQYKEMANEVVSNLSNQEVSDNYLKEMEKDPIETVLVVNKDDFNVQLPSNIKIENDSYIRLIGNPITEEYSTFEKLSDSQLEKVFNKLNLVTSNEVFK